MGLISALGLDIKSLIAQLINFAIIYFILQKFAWKPIMGLLEKRQKEIADGLKMSKAAEETLVASNEEKEAMLLKARQEASELLTQAQNQAEQTKNKALRQAREQAAAALAQNELKMERQKENMVKEAQQQIAQLVVLGVEKVTTQAVDEKKVEKVYLQEGLR